jgi:hypothetical protein
MKRKHLYILYIGLWICLFTLILSAPIKRFVNELAGRGSLIQALLFIYGVPVSLLYLLSAFLFDVRAEVISKEQILSFFERRRMLIMMFLFVIIAVILLILTSFAP